MAVNPNEDTEFNEALRKHGILPPLKPRTPSPSPPPSPTLHDKLSTMNLTSKDLDELADDINDDDAEQEIIQYRERMLKEMRREEKAGRFGTVIPIGRDDYTREVTEASKVDEPIDEAEEDNVDLDDEDSPSGEGKRSAKGRGTGVVCFLYKDGIPRSDRTYTHIRSLAAKHPRTKFVSIVGDKCIPNLPDSRIPMLIVYRGGEIRTQVVSWAADKERRMEELEALLVLCGAIIPSPRQLRSESQGIHGVSEQNDTDEESEDDDESGLARSRSTFTNHTTKNIRGPAKTTEDSDSDFDL